MNRKLIGNFDLDLVESDTPMVRARDARDRRRHARPSPTPRGSEPFSKEDANDDDKSGRHSKSLSSSLSSTAVPATAKTPQSERRTQPVCMRGTGDWEPVIAMIDDSSKTSLLDPDTANMLGLTLHPIPRRRALSAALSNSATSKGRFFASNVGLRSVSIDFPPVTVSIMVAPISVDGANVVIGSELLQELEVAAEQGETQFSRKHCDVAANDSENNLMSAVGNSLIEGGLLFGHTDTSADLGETCLDNAQLFSESSSASPTIFSTPSFPGHLASVHRDNESYWISDLLTEPDSIGAQAKSEYWELAGCGGSFEGGLGTINTWP
ncbi:hypothetical protein AK830_g5618 [Neonectria ditissima]|uniref:Uncharacterized protein n=1 Tax=Neonectria ditissima TaxID=78410 RepID=A0A0P7BLI9_9HYPO|nr:hypothetical protein AK830_g5618 [Neonectria ditissima]